MASRRNFLFNLFRAAAVIAVAPSLVVDSTAKDPEILKILTAEPIHFMPKYIRLINVSAELLEDVAAFNEAIKREDLPDKDPINIEVGYLDDDFEKNRFTVKLTYI